jgi:hypothetical protein
MSNGAYPIKALFREAAAFLRTNLGRIAVGCLLPVSILCTLILWIYAEYVNPYPLFEFTTYLNIYYFSYFAVCYLLFAFLFNLYYKKINKVNVMTAFYWTDRHTILLIRFIIFSILLFAGTTAIDFALATIIFIVLPIEINEFSLILANEGTEILFYVSAFFILLAYLLSVFFLSLILAYYTPWLLTAIVDENKTVVTSKQNKEHDRDGRFVWVFFYLILPLDALFYLLTLVSQNFGIGTFPLLASTSVIGLSAVIFGSVALANTNRRIILAQRDD